MILLDISIISELLRDTPAAQVIEWIDAQPLETLYLSATTVAALQAAVARLPSEERRAHVHAGLEKRLLPLFAGRILPFDQSCTKAYAEAITKVEKGGSEILPVDGYIAAIAAAHGLIVAARETVAFEAAGVDTINPWRVHSPSINAARQKF